MDPNFEFNDSARQLANDILTWIGFGTVVGLLAKAIMPGRDPGGAVMTLVMGIGGTIIGCGTVSFFRPEGRVMPLTPLGLVVATIGAFIILAFYRLLSGHFFLEGTINTTAPRQSRTVVDEHHAPARRPRRRRATTRAVADYED